MADFQKPPPSFPELTIESEVAFDDLGDGRSLNPPDFVPLSS